MTKTYLIPLIIILLITAGFYFLKQKNKEIQISDPTIYSKSSDEPVNNYNVHKIWPSDGKE